MHLTLGMLSPSERESIESTILVKIFPILTSPAVAACTVLKSASPTPDETKRDLFLRTRTMPALAIV